MPKKEETKVEETVVETPVEETAEFTVSDPSIVRPKELPLIITPNSGKWANSAQAEFAQTLNGYAYKNPEKWELKKDALLKQLSELGKNPSALNVITGNGATSGKLKYGNQLIQTSEDKQ